MSWCNVNDFVSLIILLNVFILCFAHSPEGDEVNTTKTITTSTSVQALSKRYLFYKLSSFFEADARIFVDFSYTHYINKPFVIADSLELRMSSRAGLCNIYTIS